MLTVDRLCVDIGRSRILGDVSLRVGAQEVVCLVGRNGAGKTTTLRTIMGYLAPASGTIDFDGRRLNGLPTHAIAAMGVAFSPEEAGIFGALTVGENIEIATWTRASRRSPAERMEQAYTVFPNLRRYASRGGTQISGGERKMLSIARALALDPELLLLDEPFEGPSPSIIPAVGRGIAAVTRLGPGTLLPRSNSHHLPADAGQPHLLAPGRSV